MKGGVRRLYEAAASANQNSGEGTEEASARSSVALQAGAEQRQGARTEAAVVLDRDGVRREAVLGHLLPDGVDVGPVEVARAVPTPAPDCSGGRWRGTASALGLPAVGAQGGEDAPYSGFASKTTSSVSSLVKSRSCGPSARARGRQGSVFWAARGESGSGRTPRPVLRVGVRVVRQAADPAVASDGGQVAPVRVDDAVDLLLGADDARRGRQ